jgi:LacI family transcriptional regulator
MGVEAGDPEVQKLLASQTPIIGVDLEIAGPRASYVTSDNITGARLAVRHLHALGHTRIATVSGPPAHKAGGDRLVGYRAELQAHGLEIPAGYEQEGDWYAETGESSMHALLRLPAPPTAVFIASDMMAVGALKAIRDAGLRCPQDVAVVGFDDSALASLLSPSLTTVRQEAPEMGIAAGRSLIEMIENPQVVAPVRVLPVELVARESCGGGNPPSAAKG